MLGILIELMMTTHLWVFFGILHKMLKIVYRLKFYRNNRTEVERCLSVASSVQFLSID